jgi:hypothetical protein
LATPQKHKLASGRKGTRQNPDGKLITPVNDPEIFLRARGSFEATATVYKPKNPPLNTKFPSEPSTSYSPRFHTKNPKTDYSEIRIEIHQTFPSINKGKGPLERSLSFDIPSFLRQNFLVSPYSKECVTPLSSTPKSMAGVGGGGGGQQNVPPPRVFAKLAARYAPLVLPVPLQDLPENYIKNLPKFTGEGDLTAAEHINFFDQFADICGIEHEDVYSRLLVQTFEG